MLFRLKISAAIFSVYPMTPHTGNMPKEEVHLSREKNGRLFRSSNNTIH
jgi:hypothetical protein